MFAIGLKVFEPIQSFPSIRCFSTTSVAPKAFRLVTTRRVAQRPDYKVGEVRPKYMPKKRAAFPDYKYGEAQVYKQSNKGLYGGLFKSSGSRISESKNKVKRTWKVNVHRKSLWSEALKRDIDIKVAARVLRTISKEGGVDNYLTKDKSARIKELGPTGWKLRYLVKKAQYQEENLPHKAAPTFKTKDGKKGKVYFSGLKIEGYDQPLNLTVGKRRLTMILYQQEKIEKKALGETITLKELANKYFGYSVEQIATALSKFGFDLNQISYSGQLNYPKLPKAQNPNISV